MALHIHEERGCLPHHELHSLETPNLNIYNGKIKSESTSAYEVNSEGAGLASAYFKTGMV